MSNHLPLAAREIWKAFEEMELSKKAHFGYLTDLEIKYRDTGSPSATENSRLEKLLDKHDKCVSRFRLLIQQLRSTDIYAYEAFIKQLKLKGSQPSST